MACLLSTPHPPTHPGISFCIFGLVDFPLVGPWGALLFLMALAREPHVQLRFAINRNANEHFGKVGGKVRGLLNIVAFQCLGKGNTFSRSE